MSQANHRAVCSESQSASLDRNDNKSHGSSYGSGDIVKTSTTTAGISSATATAAAISIADLEQGTFYTINRSGLFMKRHDGLDSLPSSKDATKMTDPIIVKTAKYSHILHVLFSTAGLITMILVLIIFGVLLGLIPLFITEKPKSTTNYSISQTTSMSFTSISTWPPHQTDSTNPLMSSQSAQTGPTTRDNTQSADPTATTSSAVDATGSGLFNNSKSTGVTAAPDVTATSSDAVSTSSSSLSTPPPPPASSSHISSEAVSTPEPSTEYPTSTGPHCTPPDLSRLSLLPSNYSSNQCLNSSILIPSRLTLYSSYLFGYPIQQTLSCYGSKLELKCPGEQRLHILSAYYGIQPSNNLNYCCQMSPLQTSCFFDETFAIIYDFCESKTTCPLTVSQDYFGDPCKGTPGPCKQLFVQYVCIDDPTTSTTTNNQTLLLTDCDSIQNSTINETSICPRIGTGEAQYEQNWCQPSLANITCPDLMVINITCAFYGIDKNFLCPNVTYDMPPRECYSSDSFERVKRECNGHQYCIYDGQNGFEGEAGFVNVCPGLTSSLFVQWNCLPNSTISNPTTTSSMTSNYTSESSLALPTCHVNTTQTLVEDTCAASSAAYEPQPLINSTQTYFGYPISQQIVCQGSRLILLCPLELVIRIYSAYYGVQSATMSATCIASLAPDAELPAKCYIPNALASIRATCDNENSCQLRASANTLGGGDYCPSYPKQLLVQYQCVHPSVLNSTMAKCQQEQQQQSEPTASLVVVPSVCNATNSSQVQSKSWCDGSSVSISCASGRTIRIVCAFYGVHPNIGACNMGALANPPVCYFASSASVLSAACNGRASCSIDQLATKFTPDPCSGLDKALFAQWRCV